MGRHPAAEARATARINQASRQTLSLTQCRDARIRGSTRRSRCRASQAGREKPEGSRRWIAAIAQQYRMYCLRDADPPRSTGQFDSHDANRTTAVGASLFGYFLGHCAAGAARTAELAAKRRRAGCPESCQKVTRSPVGRVKALRSTRRARNWIPACAGMTGTKTRDQVGSGFRRNEARKIKATIHVTTDYSGLGWRRNFRVRPRTRWQTES